MVSASKTTTVMSESNPLRRRMHILERASSNTLSAGDGGILPEISHKSHRHDDHSMQEETSPSSYESHSDSDGDSDAGDDTEFEGAHDQERQKTPARPTVDTQVPAYNLTKHGNPLSPTSRAWYEFDLAVVAALVSPIGNWLTGGDHIKNLLLVVLLIFYLHQIIEIPWHLYQSARPRKTPHYLPSLSPKDMYQARAASELRRLELFFLMLTAVSPFVGAIVLRTAASSMIGAHAVSWFSTGLFVLATGMRPWAHLVDRIGHRTSDLHDIVHFPAPDSTYVQDKEQEAEAAREKLAEMMKRVEVLELALGGVKAQVKSTREEVVLYVDDALETVERAGRKQERRWERHEGRVKEVENGLASVVAGRAINTKEGPLNTYSFTSSFLGYVLPTWLYVPSGKNLYGTPYSSTASSPRHLLRSFPSSSNLETIAEEDNSAASLPILAQPSYLTSNILFRTGYVLTMPLRAAVRMALRNY